jgi:alanine racemase
MPRPILATVHLPALRHNLARARRAAADAKVWAVVKANAYGHGIERVFEGMRSADGFALLDLAEAQRLRALDWRAPFCCWRAFSNLATWKPVHGSTFGTWSTARNRSTG